MSVETLRLEGDLDNVVVRFAPNPNGPMTIGHARGVAVNNYIAKKYDGKFILRFDDTDPRIKRPLIEAYRWMQEDCEWLGAKPDEVITASKNLESYYDVARQVIEQGNAYVCTCEREAFKTRKNQGIECPHRNQSISENIDGWDKMFGGYNEGDAVLRIKTDIKHPDPALRDWSAFRIIDESHPLVGDKFRVWPMLDFESAVEDHVRKTTHIIRGIDLLDSGLKQKYLYDYLCWEYPQVILWGRLKIEGIGKFSTSKISADIASGKVNGWDDPSIPTLRAFRRRGILPEAITEFMLELGLSESAISISMDNLYSLNRKKLDESTNRYFFISDPVKLFAKGIPGKTIRMPLHPSFKERGVREHCMVDGSCFYISKPDADLAKEEIIKLMGLPCIRIDEVSKDEVTGSYVPGKVKTAKKIQCIQDYISCKILTPDGEDNGYCEPHCQDLEVGTIVQFERYGFCRLDSKEENYVVFVFGHK